MFFGACLFLGSSAYGGVRMESVQLQHRSAEQVAASLKPLLWEGEAAVAQEFTLTLQATDKRLEALKSLAIELDKPVRRLLVSLQYENGRGAVDDANTQAIASTVPKGGASLYRVATLEGSQAWIQTREDVLVPGLFPGLASGMPFAAPGFVYRSADRGLSVLPIIGGDGLVRVRVSLQREAFAGSPAQLQGAGVESEVSGRLGEWIYLGGTRNASTATGISTRAKNKVGSWRLRVEEARD